MIPIVGALLTTLAENGLTLLSSAIQAKGKQVVEEKLGVKIAVDQADIEDVAAEFVASVQVPAASPAS